MNDSIEALDMQGYLTIQIFNRTGQLIHTTQKHNAIVYTGRDLVAKLFTAQKIDPIRYLAVGVGGNPVNPTKDTRLQTEVFRKELNLFDLSQDLTDLTDLTNVDQDKLTRRRIKLKADLDFNQPNPDSNNGQPYELKEAGLFNNNEPGKGVMYNRVVFPNISKTSEFKLTFVWEIVF